MTELSDIATIVDCEHKTAPESLDGSYFAVGTPAMRGNSIDYSLARRIDKPTFGEWTRRLTPLVGDILFAREAPVGPAVRIPESENVAPGQRTVLIRPNTERIDSAYLYYRLVSPQLQRMVDALSAGSTVSHLNVADVRSLLLGELPALNSQRAIGEVLGALDDKIAANRKVIKVGDQLIAAKYASTEKSDKGRTFAEVADIGGGGTPSTKEQSYWAGDVRWATPTDVTASEGPWLVDTSRRISGAGLDSCASPLYPEGSILMTSRATIGAVVVAQKPMAVNQGFIVLNAKESDLQWWIESQVRGRTHEFESWANGATFLEISRGNFKSLSVLECSAKDLEAFNDVAQPVRELQAAAQSENLLLARTRDELLPLLMNGRITVKDAERAAEDVL